MSRPVTDNAQSRRPFTAWLLDAATPRFGLVVTWLLCLFAIVLACSPIEFSDGVRSAQGASLFSWLPETLLRSGPDGEPD